MRLTPDVVRMGWVATAQARRSANPWRTTVAIEQQATPRQIRAEHFPDLDDEVMYPRLSRPRSRSSRALGTRRTFAPGETLYAQGQRDAPFLVIERGRVRVLDRKPGKDVWIADADAGTFLGDIATFTGEPAIAECVADEQTDVIAFDRPELRAMLAAWPEMAELVLRTMMARREWHEANGYGVLRLIAPRGSRRAFEVRDLLERNLIPVRWYDVDTDPESAAMLDWLADPARGDAGPRAQHRRAAQPLGRPGRPRARPARRDRRRALRPGRARRRARRARRRRVRRLRGPAHARGRGVGARAGRPAPARGSRTTSASPPGSPARELTRKATLQARRFDAVLSSFHRAVELARGAEGLVRVDLDDGQHALARTVVVATGARWRTLAAATSSASPAPASTTPRWRPTPSAAATRT